MISWSYHGLYHACIMVENIMLLASLKTHKNSIISSPMVLLSCVFMMRVRLPLGLELLHIRLWYAINPNISSTTSKHVTFLCCFYTMLCEIRKRNQSRSTSCHNRRRKVHASTHGLLRWRIYSGYVRSCSRDTYVHRCHKLDIWPTISSNFY